MKESNLELKSAKLETPLGPMLAVADEKVLYVLEFIDGRKLELTQGSSPPLRSIAQELERYFKGELKAFKTPLAMLGTPFQKRVWEELAKIPHGETRSYAAIAKALSKPTAYRAVAQANGANPFTIIIPCHRVINANGALGGYGGGLDRKRWLLNHERQRCS